MNAAPPPPPSLIGNLPPIYTMQQAMQALRAEPREFTVIIDGEPRTIEQLYKRLLKGPVPMQEIYVYHPDAWIMTFSKYDPESDEWVIYRSSPLSKYGVLTRTYGTIVMDIPPEDIHEIWDIIMQFFPMAWATYHAAEIRRGRVQNIYAKKLLEAGELAGVPENVDPLLESFILNRPRAREWREGKANLARINTSLFNNNNNNNPLSRINTRVLRKNRLARKSRRSNRKTRKN